MRIGFYGGCAGDATGLASILVHDPDITAIDKGQLGSAEGRLSKQAGALRLQAGMKTDKKQRQDKGHEGFGHG